MRSRIEEHRDPTAVRSRRWVVPALLFVVCVLVFNANLRYTGSYDSLASSLIPLRLLDGRGLGFEDPSGLIPGTGYSIVPSRQGGWVSFYPLVTPLLVTPLYVPVVAWGRAHPFVHPEVPQVAMEKLSASLVAAASVVVLFLLLRRLTRPRLALLLAAGFAFGTGTWAVSSQALWQHGTAGLLLSLSLLLLLPSDTGGPWRIALVGLVAGLMAANRPTDVLFWLAAGVVLLSRHRLKSWPFFVVSALLGGLAIAWNLHHFGALTGGYGTYTGPDGRLVGQNQFGLPGMLGLLLSNRGLFTFSPFLLLALGWRPAKDGNRFPGLWLFLVAYAGSLYLHGQSFDWAGGMCYGARYALHGLPVLFVAMVGPLERAMRAVTARALFGAALVFSAFIQGIGAFCYPGDDSGNWRRHGLWTVTGSSPVVAMKSGLADPHFLYPFVRSIAMTRPLAGSDARGRLEVEGCPSTVLQPGARIELSFRLLNQSTTTWSSLGGYFSRGAIKVRTGFVHSDGQAGYQTPSWIAARLEPGETASRSVVLHTPRESGRYVLRTEVFQVGFGALPPRECPPVDCTLEIRPGKPAG